MKKHENHKTFRNRTTATTTPLTAFQMWICKLGAIDLKEIDLMEIELPVIWLRGIINESHVSRKRMLNEN